MHITPWVHQSMAKWAALWLSECRETTNIQYSWEVIDPTGLQRRHSWQSRPSSAAGECVVPVLSMVMIEF